MIIKSYDEKIITNNESGLAGAIPIVGASRQTVTTYQKQQVKIK